MLTVLTDFKSPYAFVANELIWSLEARYNIEIDWLPLSLNIASLRVQRQSLIRKLQRQAVIARIGNGQ